MRVKQIFLVFILCMFAFCSNKNVDTVIPGEYVKYENPVIIEYSAEKEEVIQQKWDEFKNKYKYTENIQSVNFNNVSSYLENVQFEPTYPLIFRFPFKNITREEISTAVMEFYNTWKDLFGCSPDNLLLRTFSADPVTEEITLSYSQEGLHGKKRTFVNFHFLTIVINMQGQLLGISSNLVPDIYLYESGPNPFEKMKENVCSYTVYSSPDDTVGYTFKEEDQFLISGTFVIVVKSETSLSIYEARGLSVRSYELDNILGRTTYYYFYFSQYTGEILYVRRT